MGPSFFFFLELSAQIPIVSSCKELPTLNLLTFVFFTYHILTHLPMNKEHLSLSAKVQTQQVASIIGPPPFLLCGFDGC